MSFERWKELFGPGAKQQEPEPVKLSEPTVDASPIIEPNGRLITRAEDVHGLLKDIGNASHRPLLLLALEATRGSPHPVAELGAGHGSTPYLNRYCSRSKRKLVSFENNQKWSEEFAKFDGNYFQRIYGNWDNAPLDQDWSVALADHAPEGRRHVDITRLAHKAAIIVIHDTEPRSSGYMLEKIWPLFKYRSNIVTEEPYADSAAVSNFIDVTKWSGTRFVDYPYAVT